MEPRFTVKSIQLAQESFELEIFADLDQEFTAHFDEMSDPTKGLPEPPLFGCLWPAAEGLALYLLEQKTKIKGKRVLEIGCGLGLPSLLCARMGAQVETMDHHPGVASLLMRNCQRNQLPKLMFHLSSFQKTQTRLGEFDLIIGSDILYEPDVYPQLEAFILQQAAPSCQIILADPGRYAVHRFGAILKQKFHYSMVKQEVPHHEHLIEIHRYQFP
jgi:predicted nicotinamide N-methyase